MKPAPAKLEHEVSEEVSEALPFLGPILRPLKPQLLGPEYPLVYGMPGRGGARLIKENGQPVAGAVFAAFDAVSEPALPSSPLRIGAIGSVGTHPDHRGKGLARAAVGRCEEALRGQGCSLALLWSQVPEVFRKLGYAEAGVEIAFSISEDEAQKLPRPAGAPLPFDAEKDLGACHALYESQPVRVRRTKEEFRQLASIPGMELWIHRRAGKTTAYAAIGKGTDFPETMHEWAGETEGVISILRHYLAQNQRVGINVISSGARPDFIAALAGWGLEPVYGVMGLFKILDPESLARSASQALAAHGARACYEAGKFLVEKEGATLVYNETQFLRFLFGYRGVTGENLEAARVLGVKEFQASPVLRIFFWGLDSI